MNSESDSGDRAENRRQHRRHAVANLKLQNPVVGEVLNTSHLGMAVETHSSLTVGWSYAFRLRHGADVIRVPGKVEWCRLVELMKIDDQEYLPVFRLGIRLAGNLWAKPQVHYYP